MQDKIYIITMKQIMEQIDLTLTKECASGQILLSFVSLGESMWPVLFKTTSSFGCMLEKLKVVKNYPTN